MTYAKEVASKFTGHFALVYQQAYSELNLATDSKMNSEAGLPRPRCDVCQLISPELVEGTGKA